MYQTGHEKLYISEEIQSLSNISQVVVSSPVMVAATSTTPSAVTTVSMPSGGHSEAKATTMPTSKSIDWKLATGSIPMMKQASGGYGFYVSGSPSGKNCHCGCELGLLLLFCVNFASVSASFLPSMQWGVDMHIMPECFIILADKMIYLQHWTHPSV